MSRRGTLKLALVVTVALGFGAAYGTGLLHTLADPSSLRQKLVNLGALGYVAFVVAYAVVQPFGVPGTVFVWAAPLVWPWHVAFALSMAGTMAASVVGFSFARFIARDWVTPRIPERFRRYEDLLERRGLAAVFVLRLIFWMPPLLHAFFGVSRVSFGAHFWGSLLGYAIPLFLVSFFGERAFELARAAPLWVWGVAGGVAISAVVTAAGLRRRRARGRDAGGDQALAGRR